MCGLLALLHRKPINSRGPDVRIDDDDEGRESAKSRLVLMMQPNDRHKATLPFTYDGYRRLRGPKLLFTGRFCGGLALFFTYSVQSIFLEVPDGSLL